MKPIPVLVTAVCLLAAACGGSGPDPAAVEVRQKAAPAAAEPEATPTPEPSPTSTAPPDPTTLPTPMPAPAPDPTPVPPHEGVCPDSRDNAGAVFRYDRYAQPASIAIEANCGSLVPVSGVCSDYRERAGAAWRYDPDETTSEEALEEQCGPVVVEKPTATPRPPVLTTPAMCADLLGAPAEARQWADAGFDVARVVAAWPENPQIRYDALDIAWAFGDAARILRDLYSFTSGPYHLRDLSRDAADSLEYLSELWEGLAWGGDILIANLQLLSTVNHLASFADAADTEHRERC